MLFALCFVLFGGVATAGGQSGGTHWWQDAGLPSGHNNAAPAGYKPIAGAGPCTCTQGSGTYAEPGGGLGSCGTLCCAASPYTDPDPSGEYYAGNVGYGGMCYEPEKPGSTGRRLETPAVWREVTSTGS